ncbi:unnamed protein product [Alopecurus aequalis]
MPPARRRRRTGPAAGDEEPAPSYSADLLALATTLLPTSTAAATLKTPPHLKHTVHSLPDSHPVLLSLPQTLAQAISHDSDSSSPRVAAAAVLLHLLLTHPSHPPHWDDLLRPLALLHDRLAKLATDDPPLAALAASCFELAWRSGAPGRDALVAQTLPYLFSRVLTSGSNARPLLRRLFALREALPLLDYTDESISDFKMLLLRCFVSLHFLKTEEGRKLLALVLGVSEGLAREGLELIRAQVGMMRGRRAAVVSYGEVVFRAWKDGGWVTGEIGEDFLQGMVEAAVHAANKEVAKAARRILWAFVEQKAVAGVEKLVFRLSEPGVFRSLQVANSNVRLNALYLLLDVFPLEDPDVTKDVNDPLLEKQFFLLDKLLMDDCPEIRAVTVEGLCRILNQFWEVIPSPTISKKLSKIVDDMFKDSCNDVRLSTLNGLIYLLDNPQSHDILKVLLPRLSDMVCDPALSVRAAAIDLLLAIRDLRSFQYNKVVGLGTLLSSLADDHPRVAQKITKLLIPSYFPSKLSLEEACVRCITLIKRSPAAGARFCEFALSEGSSPRSLVKFIKRAITVASSSSGLNSEQTDGLIIASAKVIKSLSDQGSSLVALSEYFAKAKLKLLFKTAFSDSAQAALLSMVTVVSPDDLRVLHAECMDIIVKAAVTSKQEECHEALLAAHKLVISQVYIEQCLHFESLDLTPVLAYSSLATYSALQDDDHIDTGCSESKTINRSLDHLLKCYDKFANGFVTVSADSTSTLNKNEKSAEHKHPQHGTFEENSVKGTINVIMLGTSILKFIVDTTTIKLVNDSKVRCVKFASAYTKYAVSAMKGHHESSSFDGDDLKDILTLTRSSVTYAAKLLHLVLASSTESSSSLEEAFLLANNLLDLVPAVESFAGSRFALTFVSVLKQWLPVLLLGLGCRWLIGPENGMASNMWNLGDSDLPMWVVALAKNELLDAEEAREDDQSEQGSAHEDSPSSRKLAEMMVILLKKGSPRIMDSVGGILLSALQSALQNAEHSVVLGLTRFICARLLGSNSSATEKLQLTLDSLCESFFEIDRHCRDNLVVDEGPRQQLESAKVLIQSVLSDL